MSRGFVIPALSADRQALSLNPYRFRIKCGMTIVFCLSIIVFLFFSALQVEAATKPAFSVKIRKDRKAIKVYFKELNTAKSVSYELTYLGNDIQQGVVGSVYAKEGNSASRLLLFGTCSKNVCTYHNNIKNSQLKIKYKLKNNKTYLKRYKIKI